MHPARRLVSVAVILLLLTALLTVAPLGVAGSAEDPEITDPAGDQVITGGGPLQSQLDPDDFDDVDITAAWINETDDETFFITVRSTAAVQDDTRTLIHFNVTLGPESVFGSTASGEEFTVDLRGSDVQAGPDNITASSQGTDLTVTIPRASVGASGGDHVGGFFVERSRSTGQTAPVLAPGENASDRAPDSGFGREYALARPAIVPAVTLTINGGTATTTEGAEPFSGTEVTVTDADATVTFNVQVRNAGTDVDTFTLSSTVSGSATGALATTTFSLDPGASAQTTLQVTLSDAEGSVTATVNAVSERGATGAAAGTVVVEAAAGGGDDEEGGLFDAFPGNLPDWLWILIFALLFLLLLLLIILLLVRRRDDEEEEGILAEDDEDNPLAEGLSPEDIAYARRLFEEREARYRDYAHPDRDRSLDPDLPPEPAGKTRHFHPDGTECFHPPSIWADQGHAKPLRRLRRGRDNN